MNFEIDRVNAVVGGEAYLISAGDDVVLADSGYSVDIVGTIKNIGQTLDGRKLNHIILRQRSMPIQMLLRYLPSPKLAE